MPNDRDGIFSLRGRRALVTGSSRGIGLAIAEAMAAAGSEVILHGRDTAALAAARAAIVAAGGRATIVTGDLADPDGPRALAAAALAGGAVDILVNNAGINIRQSLPDLTTEAWDTVLRLDLSAAIFLAQALTPGMIAAGWGRIVNIGSIMSVRARAGIPAYAAAKHGLAGITKALAAELGPKGVTANAVAPGFVLTEGTAVHQGNPAFMEMVEKRTPAGRWGSPQDIAGAIVYLASDAAGFVNGHTLMVDGGLTATI